MLLARSKCRDSISDFNGPLLHSVGIELQLKQTYGATWELPNLFLDMLCNIRCSSWCGILYPEIKAPKKEFSMHPGHRERIATLKLKP